MSDIIPYLAMIPFGCVIIFGLYLMWQQRVVLIMGIIFFLMIVSANLFAWGLYEVSK